MLEIIEYGQSVNSQDEIRNILTRHWSGGAELTCEQEEEAERELRRLERTR